MAKTKLGSLGLTADILNGTILSTDLATEGTSGYHLETNGSGTISWQPEASGSSTLLGLTDTDFSALTPATGQIIVHDGTDWINVVPPSSGDVTIAADGTMTIGSGDVTGTMIANSTITSGNMTLATRVGLAAIYTVGVSGGGTGSTAITVTIDGNLSGGTTGDMAFTNDTKLLLRISDTAASIKPNVDALATFSGAQVIDGVDTCTAWVQGSTVNGNVVCVVDGPSGNDTFYLHVIGMEGCNAYGVGHSRGFSPQVLTFTA